MWFWNYLHDIASGFMNSSGLGWGFEFSARAHIFTMITRSTNAWDLRLWAVVYIILALVHV